MAESTYTAPATYTITFPSLSQSEVKVSIDGVLQSSGFTISGYATSGSGTVTFTSAPAAGSTVRVFRDTTILNNQAPAPKADFQSGASIQAADLNNNMDQVLYKLAEKVDEGDISADSVVTQAIRDLNVTTAKIANNAVTAAKIDSNVLTSHATQVTDIANSAATATAAAATATAQATAAATSAANAATEAGTIAGTVATAQAAATAAQAQATASAASAATSASEAAQAATDSGTAITTAQGAVTSANSAVTTANSADTKADTAITTANTADTNATSALSTANTAATAATNAVSTANTASTNATTAVNTANAASATANTADTNASAAVVTANAASATATTADTNASNAVTTANSANATANTANTNAASALTTANTANTTSNTANTTANTALTTANGAVTTANTADTNATNAVSTANSAANAVANAVLYDPIANFAAFPSSPSNLDRIEVLDSTGLQSQSIITGLPASFTGSSDLVVRLEYNSSTSKWQFKQYFAADPEARYIPKPGGTFTGPVNFEDDLIVKGDSTNGSGELTLNCENNSHGIKIKGPPHSAGANYTLTLPNDTGTNGQALTTNGSGALSFDDVSSSIITSTDFAYKPTSNSITFNDPGNSAATSGTGFGFNTTTSSSAFTYSRLNSSVVAIMNSLSIGDTVNISWLLTNGNTIAQNGLTVAAVASNTSVGAGASVVTFSSTMSYAHASCTSVTLTSSAIVNGVDAVTNNQVLKYKTATSKWTVDDEVSLSTVLPLTGGTLTGALTLSGNPTAANHAANKAYVDTEVAGVVSSAPATLDTLNELAAALGDDPNFATTTANSIGTKLPLAGGTLTGGLTGTSATFTGNVTLQANLDMQDNDKILLGTGDDLEIYHDGTRNYIDSKGTQLRIESDAIRLRSDGGETYFEADVNGAAKVYYDNSKKLETTSDGVTLTATTPAINFTAGGSAVAQAGQILVGENGGGGDLLLKTKTTGGTLTTRLTVGNDGTVNLPDNGKFTAGAGDDLEIYHNATDSIINDNSRNLLVRASGTGDLWLQSDNQVYFGDIGGNEKFIEANNNGDVKLFYDNSQKLATTTTGISVTGQIDIGTTSIYGTGDISMGDNDKLRLGTGDDLQIYHNGTNSFIDNDAGSLYIRGVGDDLYLRATDDIFIQPQVSENGIKVIGNGGVELYYDNSKKLETTSAGVTVTGGVTASGYSMANLTQL